MSLAPVFLHELSGHHETLPLVSSLPKPMKKKLNSIMGKNLNNEKYAKGNNLVVMFYIQYQIQYFIY